MLEIRTAMPEDAARLLAYLNQIGGESDNLLFGANEMNISVEREAAYIQSVSEMPNSVMLIGLLDGDVVSVGSIQGFGRPRIAHRGSVAISVGKAHWGQGIGTRMLQALLDFSREAGLEILELEVRSDNASAIRLYEKLGFRKFGTYPGFFRIRGQYYDADYMTLKL